MNRISKQFCLLFLFLISVIGINQAQSTPVITIHTETAELQYSLYSSFYATHDVDADIRWIAKNDSAAIAFITDRGAEILVQLSTLSGFNWPESTIDLYLVRYYPTPGSADPLVIPIGAVRDGDAAIAAPTGDEFAINLLFQLAKRLLLHGAPDNLKSHPLLDKDPYYVDNLAMLLARYAGLQLFDNTSVQTVLDSPFWQKFWTGRLIYNRYLAGKWVLSPDKPLITYLNAEPTDSDFSRAAKTETNQTTFSKNVSPDLIPSGRLGLAIADDGNKRLLIAAVDETKIAYLSGVRTGDRIININGQQPRSVREATELILKRLDSGGASVDIARGGTTRSFVLRPRKSN